jgi:hypothetical protein
VILDAGFWQNGWTIGIGVGLTLWLLELLRRRLFPRRAAPSTVNRTTTSTRVEGVHVGGDVQQSGSGTNVVGHTVTIHGAPSAAELAKARLRAADNRSRAVEQARRDITLAIVLATGGFESFLREPPDDRATAQVASAVDQWNALRGTLPEIVDPELVQEVHAFFEDARHHFLVEGPPSRETVRGLLDDGNHLLTRVNDRLSA